VPDINIYGILFKKFLTSFSLASSKLNLVVHNVVYDHHPSVLMWHCWLGHLTRKIVSEMTYNVSSGTLNPTIPYQPALWHGARFNVPGNICYFSFIVCQVNYVLLGGVTYAHF